MTGNSAVAEPREIAGRYVLREVVGRGGMGTVWKAEDRLLHRTVAVKEVSFPPGVSEEERHDLVQRTLREARASARLDHPGAVTVYDVLAEGESPCIVMRLLRGRTLTQVVAEDGPLPPVEVARIGLQLLDTLMAAHALGIVHRDVKPANVMLLPSGRVVLTDFGIAVTADDTTLTRSGLLVGSPSYISPERARGERAGPASDLWSLGATLFAAVEGRPPFTGEDPHGVLNAVLVREHVPFRRAGPLAGVIDALLEKDPAKRLPAAGALGMLSAAERESAEQAAPPAPAAGNVGSRTAMLAVPANAKARPANAKARPAAAASPSGTAFVADGRRRRRVLWLGLLVLLLAGGSTAAALQLTGAPSRAPAARSTPPTTLPPTTASSSPSPAAPPSRTAGSPAPSPGATTAAPPAVGITALPSGWRRYDAPAGWSVGVPPGWHVQLSGAETDLLSPSGATHLRVDTTDTPGPSAVGAWQAEERSFAASHADYRRIYLGPATYRGYAQVADWQFTWRQGVVVEAVDRGIVTNGHGYGIFFAAPAADWASSQPLLRDFYGTFQP